MESVRLPVSKGEYRVVVRSIRSTVSHPYGRTSGQQGIFDHRPITIVWIKLTWLDTITYSEFTIHYLEGGLPLFFQPHMMEMYCYIITMGGSWRGSRKPATLHWPPTTLPSPLSIVFNIAWTFSENFLLCPIYQKICGHSVMLHLSRRAIPGALNGRSNLFIPLLDLSLLITTPVRAGLISGLSQSTAPLSTSSIKSATALERQGQPGQPLTASGKVRKEVPLPSQEKKEGAMQYVLFVSRMSIGLPYFRNTNFSPFAIQDHAWSSDQLGSPGFPVADDIRSCLLRSWDDAFVNS